MRPTLIMDKTREAYGRTFYRLLWDGEEGGWAETLDSFPLFGICRGRVYNDALIFAEARVRGGRVTGGWVLGGLVRGGRVTGGVVSGNAVVRGGVVSGGEVSGNAVVSGGLVSGGVVSGNAVVSGGLVSGGEVRGGVHTCSPAMAQRSDGYCFIVHPVDGELRVWAGCRDFSWDEAMAHWNEEHQHHAETMRILKFLREQVEARMNTLQEEKA